MAADDVAIIGAGIVGLAHAWSAAERGHRVTIFERSQRAAGASVRNFGMVWPIGQPAGELYSIALASRDRWLRLANEAGLWVNPCGALHLAHRDDEWCVLEEFAQRALQAGYACRLLSAAEVLARSPAIEPRGLRGGLFSPTELGVNPRQAIHTIARWLAERYGVRLAPGINVTAVRSEGTQPARSAVVEASGGVSRFDRVVVCGGVDVPLLFPAEFRAAGLQICKLQMLRTGPQPAGWRIGPHLASGLTLRHYRSFEICPSLGVVRQRIATETPELDRFGIHVMAAQTNDNAVIVGDSHEYDDEIEPFDKTVIDEFILRELQRIITLPDWSIAERWHGVYAKHPTLPIVEIEAAPGVYLCIGTGGGGMTMSFGLAEAAWRRWTGRE